MDGIDEIGDRTSEGQAGEVWEGFAAGSLPGVGTRDRLMGTIEVGSAIINSW